METGSSVPQTIYVRNPAEALPASYPTDTEESFHGSKDDHSLQCGAEINNVGTIAPLLHTSSYHDAQ